MKTGATAMEADNMLAQTQIDLDSPMAGSKRDGSVLRMVAAAAFLAALFIAGAIFRSQISAGLESLHGWIEQAGALGIVVFIVVYALAAVTMFPGWILTVGAGLSYGLVGGTALVSVSSVLGATLAFLASRYLVRDAIERKLAAHPKLLSLDQSMAESGWKIVFLIRLTPVFPFNLLNYALGLTRVKLGHYVLASWIGMLPGTVMYVYLGTLGNLFVEGRSRTPLELGVMGLGFVATAAVSVMIAQIAKRALAATDMETPAESE